MIGDVSYRAGSQRVVFASGSAGRAAQELATLGAQRALLIANPARSAAQTVTGAADGRVAACWDDVRPHVPTELVDAALRRARDAGVDAIVAVGGGSAVGLAKALRLAIEVPFVAVPTTYAGSEMTAVYGTTTGTVKTTGHDTRVRPDTVLYDPGLTLGLPPRETAVSGLNAIAHCMESLYGERATPVTEAVALAGARHLAAGLPAACADGQDVLARARCLYGAQLAGLAIEAGLGLHHRICHAIGGSSRASHGAIHAVMLPHVAAFNAPAAPAAMAELAQALGGVDAAGALDDLARELGAPASLREIGVPHGELEQIAAAVVGRPAANPRPVTGGDVVELLERAYRGERPAGAPR